MSKFCFLKNVGECEKVWENRVQRKYNSSSRRMWLRLLFLSLIYEVWHILPSMSSVSGFYDLSGNFTQQQAEKAEVDMQGSVV